MKEGVKVKQEKKIILEEDWNKLTSFIDSLYLDKDRMSEEGRYSLYQLSKITRKIIKYNAIEKYNEVI